MKNQKMIEDAPIENMVTYRNGGNKIYEGIFNQNNFTNFDLSQLVDEMFLNTNEQRAMTALNFIEDSFVKSYEEILKSADSFNVVRIQNYYLLIEKILDKVKGELTFKSSSRKGDIKTIDYQEVKKRVDYLCQIHEHLILISDVEERFFEKIKKFDSIEEPILYKNKVSKIQKDVESEIKDIYTKTEFKDSLKQDNRYLNSFLKTEQFRRFREDFMVPLTVIGVVFIGYLCLNYNSIRNLLIPAEKYQHTQVISISDNDKKRSNPLQLPINLKNQRDHIPENQLTDYQSNIISMSFEEYLRLTNFSKSKKRNPTNLKFREPDQIPDTNVIKNQKIINNSNMIPADSSSNTIMAFLDGKNVALRNDLSSYLKKARFGSIDYTKIHGLDINALAEKTNHLHLVIVPYDSVRYYKSNLMAIIEADTYILRKQKEKGSMRYPHRLAMALYFDLTKISQTEYYEISGIINKKDFPAIIFVDNRNIFKENFIGNIYPYVNYILLNNKYIIPN